MNRLEKAEKQIKDLKNEAFYKELLSNNRIERRDDRIKKLKNHVMILHILLGLLLILFLVIPFLYT